MLELIAWGIIFFLIFSACWGVYSIAQGLVEFACWCWEVLIPHLAKYIREKLAP